MLYRIVLILMIILAIILWFGIIQALVQGTPQ